jgi:hydroxymethylbilane synthase
LNEEGLMMMKHVILGTRGSELALMQTTMVTGALEEAVADLKVEREIIHTIGDKRTDLRFADFHGGEVPLADKGIFIKELEVALDEGRVHAAVHSLKDVPSELEARFQIAAVLPRAPIEDVLITREAVTLETLKRGARVGTSSVRRARQLKWLRPDVQIVEIRGNVATRVRKVLNAELSAVLSIPLLATLMARGVGYENGQFPWQLGAAVSLLALLLAIVLVFVVVAAEREGRERNV